MRIAILETGRPPGPLRGLYPSYPDMFTDFLNQDRDAFQTETIAIVDNAPPPPPEAYDGFLVTGSPAGVYEDTPWMAPLRDSIRAVAAAQKPMVGVCFGHQIIAEAMGGRVVKSDKGWGVGRHTYDIIGPQPWMKDAPSQFALAASHQDQVVVAPPEAEIVARSDFTPHAALAYKKVPIFSVQGHPEFDDAYSMALYGVRRGAPLDDQSVDAAIESLSTPDDNALLSEWVGAFYRQYSA